MLIYLLLASMSFDYIRIRASNKKQLKKLLAKRKEKIGLLFMLLIAVAIIGLASILYLS